MPISITAGIDIFAEISRWNFAKRLLDARDWRSAAVALEEAEQYTNVASAETPDDARVNDDKAGILTALAQLGQKTGDLERDPERHHDREER